MVPDGNYILATTADFHRLLLRRFNSAPLTITNESGREIAQMYNIEDAEWEWRVISAGGSKYELIGVNSGLALSVSGASKANGAKIDQYTYHGNPWQR